MICLVCNNSDLSMDLYYYYGAYQEAFGSYTLIPESDQKQLIAAREIGS